MNTPAVIFPLASPYFKISMLGFVFMYLSFLLTAILRGIGDTKTPLWFMGGGVVLNAILDPFLIIGIPPFPKLGLNGAAIASVISSIAALLAGLIYLRRKSHLVALRIRHLRLDRKIIGKIMVIGFPSMIQQIMVSLGGAFITTFVNGFGAPAIAAFGAAGRVDALAFMPAFTLSMASSALTGQNLGAGRTDRVHGVFVWSVRMGLMMVGVMVLILVVFPKLILSAFLNDASVIDIGARYLWIVAPGYLFVVVMFSSNGILNGAGKTLITMMFTFLALWVIRVPLALWLSHTALGILGIWISIDVSFFITMIVSVSYYYRFRSKGYAKPITALEVPNESGGAESTSSL
jgi:putative MATE family efflux protein